MPTGFPDVTDRVGGVGGTLWNAARVEQILDSLDSRGVSVKDPVFGAVGDGVTDDGAALEALLDASAATGGQFYATDGGILPYLPPGVYGFDRELIIPDYGSLIGAGKHLTVLKALGPNAKLTVNNSIGTNGCGPIGGFTLDGDGEAARGLNIGAVSHLRFYDIDVINWTEEGIYLSNTQNCSFENVNAHACETGLMLDNGAGSNLFLRNEFRANTVRQIAIVQDTDGSGYDGPTQNLFLLGICEHSYATADSLLYIDAGVDNEFHGYVFSTGANPPYTGGATAFPLVKMRYSDTVGASAPYVTFRQCTFIGNSSYHTCFDMAESCRVTFAPTCSITGMATVFVVDGTGAQIQGDLPRLASTTTYFTGSNGATENANITRFVYARTLWTRRTSTDSAIDVLVNDESGARFGVRADGRLQWMDGSSFSYDTNLYRNAADQLRTDDAFLSGIGFQSLRVARTATSDGTGTGTIALYTREVTVTSSDANHIIILPSASVPGVRVTLMNGATGYALRSANPGGVAINGGTGSGAESQIPANTRVECYAASSTAWICENTTLAGVRSATQVAAP